MSHYMLHAKQSDDKRRLMIGAPLVLIIVFSFGFFMMHPGDSVGHAAVSDATASKKTPADSSPSASQLQNLPNAEPAQATSSSAAVASDSTTSDSNDGSSTASSSQPASKPTATSIKTRASQVKNSKSTDTSATNNQQGLIQTVYNSLLNGR